MITLLSVLLKALIAGIILNQLLVYLHWPARVYRALLSIWKRFGYGPGISVALRRMALDARSHSQLANAMQLSRYAVETGLRRPRMSLALDVLNLAQILYRFGQPGAALGWFALADDCTNYDFRWKPTILIEFGSCLGHLGQYQEAEAVLERAAALYDPSPGWRSFGKDSQRWNLRTPTYRRQVTNARAYLAMQSGRFKDALRWYEEFQGLPGVMSRSQKLGLLNNLAAASVELGDLKTAEGYVEDAERLAGAESWVGKDYFLGTRGALRLAQGRLEEARADFTDVLTLRGPDPLTLICLGRVAFKEGAFNDAGAYLDEIKVDPTDALWRTRLAEILGSVADVEEKANAVAVAGDRRRRAKRLRDGTVPSGLPTADPLLVTARSTLAGRRFSALSMPGSVALGFYLSAFLWLGIFILLPISLPPWAVWLEAGLMLVLIVGWPVLGRWLFGPQAASSEPTAPNIKSPG